jgi:hypothetical protein
VYIINVTICASGSAVEHHLAKVGVAGPIPVSRWREGPELPGFEGGPGLFLLKREEQP